jgi:hypothetical protein
MASRILIGNNGSSYGLFVSRPGKNVTDMNEDDLIFNTNGSSTTNFLGFIQLGQVGSTTNNTTGDLSQNSNTTSSQGITQLNTTDGMEIVGEGTNGGFVQSGSTTGSTHSLATDASLTIRGITHTNPNSKNYKFISLKGIF